MVPWLDGWGTLVQHGPQTLRLRQLNRFLRRNLEHAASRWHRPVPQGHDHLARRCHQRRHARHGLPALQRIQMHPDRREHDEIERLAACQHGMQMRQAVIEPFDAGRPMQRLSVRAQFVGRLDRDHAMSHRRECRRIAPRARTDVQDAAGRIRYQMKGWTVDVREVDAFVALIQLAGFPGVTLRAADPTWHDGAPPAMDELE